MTHVSVRHLVKRHPGGVTAVDDVSLEIATGELTVLLGPSGCGKTTTLRSIAGLDDISDGEIYIGDELVSSKARAVAPERRSIGMVFQSYALWPHMTVAENLALGLKLHRVAPAAISKRVDAALELVGLRGLGHRSAGELSGGQQQRVALARAIVLEPKILLFDEPLSNLDAKMRERMRGEIRHLQKRLGITAIYVTHDQQEAMAIADRIVLMKDGRVLQVGSPRTIYHHPETRFAAEFIGSTNILSGRVIKSDQVECRDIGGLTCDASRLSVGSRVDVLFRPEMISLTENRGSQNLRPNVLHGTLSEVVFLGGLGAAEIAIGEARLQVQLSPAGDWSVGDKVQVEIPPPHVILLPSEASSPQGVL